MFKIAAEIQSHYIKAVQQSGQGQCSKRKSFIKRDIGLYTLLKPTPRLVFFCFEGTYNILVSQQNQCLWGLKYDIDCA